MTLILELLWGVLVVPCVAFTLMSMIPGKSWVLRICDFPRVQILTVCVLLLSLELFRRVAGLDLETGFFASIHPYLLALLVIAFFIQAWWAYRLMPIAPKEVPDANVNDDDRPVPERDGRSVRLIAANIDYENEQRESAMQDLVDQSPDILALIEPDEKWEPLIEGNRDAYPHIVKEIRELGRGMALLSRFPIEDQGIRYLVDEDRPSIWATLRLPAGDTLQVVVTHPPPPGLPKRQGDGRHSSKKRDIELEVIAGIIGERSDENWILTGDFNDVGWSATTLRAKHESGLGDPRVGRGMFNTFPSRWPLLRYPIDHVLVSPSFSLVSISRLGQIGSDHLPLSAELMLTRGQTD